MMAFARGALHANEDRSRPDQKGVPVFFARVDRAGNITKRYIAAKLQFARYGAGCQLGNVHQAFESPSRPTASAFSTSRAMLAKGYGTSSAPSPLIILDLWNIRASGADWSAATY